MALSTLPRLNYRRFNRTVPVVYLAVNDPHGGNLNCAQLAQSSILACYISNLEAIPSGKGASKEYLHTE